MKKEYVVLSRLLHDNDLYLPGDVVELTQEDALPLLMVGVVRQADEKVVKGRHRPGQL